MTLIFFKHYFLKNVILFKPRDANTLGCAKSISLTGINECLVFFKTYSFRCKKVLMLYSENIQYAIMVAMVIMLAMVIMVSMVIMVFVVATVVIVLRTERTDGTGQTNLTFQIEFQGNLFRTAFAILALFLGLPTNQQRFFINIRFQ